MGFFYYFTSALFPLVLNVYFFSTLSICCKGKVVELREMDFYVE